jgi:CBS domain-containing protein
MARDSRGLSVEGDRKELGMSHTEIVTARGSALTPSFEHAFVADVMRHGVISCEPEASLRDVARIMASYHIHAVVVALRENVWGVISAGDVLNTAGTERERWNAGEVAATEFVSARPEATLEEAAHMMREHEVEHLVVIEQSGKPIGMLSSLDVAGALAWGES